jgi:putative SOS response-associated peptidase YedK
MPVMLDTDTADVWLNEKQDSETLYSLFQPLLPYSIKASAIDLRYNNARIKEVPILLEDGKVLA